MGEHPLDPVGRLAHVLQHQNRPLQRRAVGRAEQVGGHRQVGHQQRSLRHAAAPRLARQGRRPLAEQQLPQPLLAPGGLGGQGGQQGAVHGAAAALGQLRPEQGGHIAEAQQPAAGQGQRLLQQPGRPPAPPQTGQQRCRLLLRCQQIAAPLGIAAGQVAPAPLLQGPRHHLQSPAPQHRQAGLQPLQRLGPLQRRAGGRQGHRIARLQRGRPVQLRCAHGQRPSTRASSSSPPSCTWWLKWRP